MSAEKTENRNDLEVKISASTLLWLMLLTCAQALVFIQAYRDIPISRDIFGRIIPLAFTIILGPFVAAAVVRILKAPSAIVAGSVLSAVGCALAMAKTLGVFAAGECLMFAGAYIYFIALAWTFASRLPAGPGAAAATAGVAAAAICSFLMRRAGLGVAPFGFVTVALSIWAFANLRAIPAREPVRTPGAAAGSFSLLLIGFPVYFIVYVFGKPEYLASRCMSSYGVTTIAIAAGLTMACIVALLWESAPAGARKALGVALLLGNIAAAVYFKGLYSFQQAAWQLGAVALCAAVAALDLYRIVAFAASRRSSWIVAAGALAALGAAFATVFLDYAYLLEHHAPDLNFFMFLPLAAFAVLTMTATLLKGDEKPWKSVSAVWLTGLVLFVPAIALAIAVGGNPESSRSRVEPLVFASLYTWYGTPDGTLGHTYTGIEFAKEGAPDDFVTESANMPAVMAGGGGPGLYRIAGNSDGKAMDSFKIGFDFPEALTQAQPTYVSIAYELTKAPKDLLLEITAGGKTYSARMPKHTKMAEVRFELPEWFSEGPAKTTPPQGMAHLSITLKGGSPDQYALLIDYVRFSRWTHYNEDYRKYYDKQKKVWYNDPPKTLATAHRTRYDGRPWPDIAPYSPDGYYDSLDRDVMTSQLKLMAKAGIDVVMFMHPPYPGVIQQGMDIIRENKLPLRVAWYALDEDENVLISNIKPIARDPLFLKVDGRPVVILGPTGMRELPPYRYAEQYARIHRAGIFVIGDNYSPPKEEMVSLMDGHYYYDTTGMYRAKWGGTAVETAQPDGTFVTGYGHLFTMFDAISRLTHAHRGVFLATVIPGFDNLSVHGFNNTPLYDGRPGTVVKRHNGATYAETWRTAIASRADWVCIVSWNELHEGSEIEPTVIDGVKYVELTRKWSDLFHQLKSR